MLDVIMRFFRSIYKFFRSGWDYTWEFIKHLSDDPDDEYFENQKHPIGSLIKMIKDHLVFFLIVGILIAIFFANDPLNNGILG